jgi:hypothetical protein
MIVGSWEKDSGRIMLGRGEEVKAAKEAASGLPFADHC